MRSSFSLHFMLVYSFATLFIFFWLMFRLQSTIFVSIEYLAGQQFVMAPRILQQNVSLEVAGSFRNGDFW